jgi:hypothetical protein
MPARSIIGLLPGRRNSLRRQSAYRAAMQAIFLSSLAPSNFRGWSGWLADWATRVTLSGLPVPSLPVA